MFISRTLNLTVIVIYEALICAELLLFCQKVNCSNRAKAEASR